MHKAIDFLARREHSVQELQQKLLQRNYHIEDISNVVDYLIQNNYLSDQRYSEALFRLRFNKGYGKYYIDNELRQKGISSAQINALHTEQVVDWTAQAALVYQKKYANKNIDGQKEKAKRVRYLQSRGFSHDEIMTVLNTQDSTIR